MQPESGGDSLFIGGRAGTFTLLFIPVALLLTATACNRRTTTPASASGNPAAPVLRIACPGEPTATIVARYSQLWSSSSGVAVRVERYDPAAGPESVPQADAWLIPPARMPHWAAAGRLQPVPAAYTEGHGPYAWDSLLRDYRTKLLIWDDKAYALPLLGDATLCFFRKDLLDDPKHQEAFQKKYGRPLGPPDTWEDFAEIAEFFHGQPRPGATRAVPSLPPVPKSDDGLDIEYFSVAAPFARRAVREDNPKPPPDVEVFSFHYDLQSGESRIASAGFQRALRFLQRLQAFRPPEPADEPAGRLQAGDAVLCLAGPEWIPRFQADVRVAGKFGFCCVPGSRQVADYRTGKEVPVPGGNHIPYLGADGWVGVVPKDAPQPDSAFALLAALSDPRTSRDIVIEPAWGGGVYRRDHLDSRVGWQAFRLDRNQTEGLVDSLRETLVHPQVKNPLVRLRTPDEQTHREALLREVRAALGGGKDAAAALAAAAAQWRELDAAKDPKTRRAEYRLSLSLSRSD
jgi:multiple sugar transport system substrate-binding protein